MACVEFTGKWGRPATIREEPGRTRVRYANTFPFHTVTRTGTVAECCPASSRTMAQGKALVVDVAGRVEGLIRTHYKERHNEHV